MSEIDTGDLGRAGHRPPIGARAELVHAARVFREERQVRVSVVEEVLVQRQGDGDVSAGPQRNVKVGLPRERRGARIDDDELRASLARFLDERDEVNARGRGVHAPEDDQPRVHVVFVGDAGHLAVEPHVGGPGRRRTDRAREARRAERAPERGIVGVVREEPVRAAVPERQDRLAAGAVANRDHPFGDVVERFIPTDAREHAVALRPLPDRRVEEAVLAVDTLGEAPDLAADVAARARVLLAAVDLDDAAVLDGDFERAGVGAVERAGGLDRRMSPGFRLPRCEAYARDYLTPRMPGPTGPLNRLNLLNLR